LVESQVNALLVETPSFNILTPPEQQRLRERMVKVGAYAASLVLDDWAQSERLGQRPLIKRKVHMVPQQQVMGKTLSAADDFRPAAANQVARVTQETLRAIAFPTFVADLIKGTFQAIVNASIEQMQAFVELLENVSQTVEQFESENITDNQARDWLAARYPQYVRVQVEDNQPRLQPTEQADAGELPDFRSELNLADTVSDLDADTIEDVLVPAARRRLAQSRLQMLSTLVMMGLQRIVVKHGRIRATMGFHIDTSDRAHREQATLFDTTTAISAAGSFLYFSASASTSITYVRSTRADSDASLNVQADLTGEVDITFESDYMPLNRLASAERIEAIRANTPVPRPLPQAVGAVPAAGPSAAEMLQTRLEHRQQVTAPKLSPPRQPQPGAPERPAAPARPQPVQQPGAESRPEQASPSRSQPDGQEEAASRPEAETSPPAGQTPPAAERSSAPSSEHTAGEEVAEEPAGDSVAAARSEVHASTPSATQSAGRLRAMA
jgi:hypothetical protein